MYKLECASGGTTLYIDAFATISAIVIFNANTTEDLTVLYHTAAGATTIVIAESSGAMLTDVVSTTDPTLTAETTTVSARILILGS